MAWKFSDDIPIYLQIIEAIKTDIVSGKYKSGDRLPAVRDLAFDAGVNPNTVQRAYAELERQGVTYTVRGKGVFVSESLVLKDRKKQELIEIVTSLLKEGEEIDLSPGEIYEEALKRINENKNGGRK